MDEEYIDLSSIGSLNAQVLMQIKHPYHTTADGQLVPETTWMRWTEAPIVETVDCGHQETICVECIDKGWSTDYYFKLRVSDGREFGLNDVPGMDPFS